MRGHCICVLIIILLSKQSTPLSLPDHWVSYFQWLERFTKEHVLVGFPQVLHPSEMILSQNAQGMLLLPFLPLLPCVIIIMESSCTVSVAVWSRTVLFYLQSAASSWTLEYWLSYFNTTTCATWSRVNRHVNSYQLSMFKWPQHTVLWS